MSYDYRKLDRFAESDFWTDWAFWSKSGFWQIFAMTFPETLNTKVADNDFGFLLVTHMAYFDARFGNYGILKSGWGCRKLSGQTVQTGERSGFKSQRCMKLDNNYLQIP
jgi:hypothetical protein